MIVSLSESSFRTPPAILMAEAISARIEGIVRADPDLGRVWRTACGMTEAVASVSLDHSHLPEAAIIMRMASNDSGSIDARGAEMAGQLTGLLFRPPDFFSDPVAAIRKIEMVTRPVGELSDETDRLDDAEILDMADKVRPWLVTPVMAGLRGAAIYAHASRRSSPVAERALFLIIEDAARRLDAQCHQSGAEVEPDDFTVFCPTEAHWITAPATALTRGGFRLWSPLSNHNTLFKAIAAQLRRELGTLGTMRAELSKLDRAAEAAHGRSRMKDFVSMIRRAPILTSGMVTKQLGVTRMTALSLILRFPQHKRGPMQRGRITSDGSPLDHSVNCGEAYAAQA